MKTVKFESVEEFLQRGGVVTIYSESQKKTTNRIPANIARRFVTKRPCRIVQRKGIARTGEFPLGYAAMNWNRIGTNY